MPPTDDSAIWKVHGKRNLYKSEWVELWLDDVEQPGGHRFEHHVLRFPRESVYAVVVRNESILMMWRHRFITNVWGWEIPAGWVDPGETPDAAIRREVEEETGWRPHEPQKVASYYAQSGMSDMHFTLFLVELADHIGKPEDTSESSEIAWIPIRDLPNLVRAGKIQDGPALLAITYFLGICRSYPLT